MDTPAEVLRRHGLRPKHSWGQNFLGDEAVLARLCEALEPTAEDVVLELGAGLGHFTRVLLATGARVVAVERDRDLVKILEANPPPGLQVVAADAARVDFVQAAGAAELLVAGNLPYHLSSPILFRVLDQRSAVKRAVFTLQKEVVDRISADPGNRTYGLLSVLLGLYFQVDALFDIPASLFHPRPKVDSAVVRLTRLAAPRAPVSDDARFRRVVKAAFSQRRKTLSNSLKSDQALGGVDAIRQALQRAGVDGMRRAETLSVEEFAALERAFAAPVD